MNTVQTEQSDDTQSVSVVPLTLGQRSGVFGITVFVADGLFALMHAPLPLEVGGIVLATILAVKSPAICGAIKDSLPPEVVESVARRVELARARRARGDWSAWDRFLGRHLKVQSNQTQIVDADSVLALVPDQEERCLIPDKYDHLQMGETFQPHASTILSHRIGIFGIPGSGKSNALTVFIEEIGRLNGVGVPFLLCDTEDEYKALHSLCYLARPYSAGSHNVTPENAFEFGQQLLERGRQVILNLQSYESDDDAALVMIGIVEGMRSWEEAHENEDRAASFVILDEASAWLPQRVEESPLSKEKDKNKMTVLAKLQRAFFRNLVKRGRKRGMGFVFATPRPADLDKRAISCDWFFLFRQTYPNDLAVYARQGVDEETARGLQPGQCVVLNPADDYEVHYFRRRRSPDLSATPGIASLQKYKDRWAQGEDDEPLAKEKDAPVINTDKLTDDQTVAIEKLIRQTMTTLLQQANGVTVTRNVGSNVPKSADSELENDDGGTCYDVTRSGRNADFQAQEIASEPALDAGVTVENFNVHAVSSAGRSELPYGWTEQHVSLIPGLYMGIGSVDKSLIALKLSTSQRNRDFARDLLRKSGLLK